MTYCYRCPVCGATAEHTAHDATLTCYHGFLPPDRHAAAMVRDWKAEAVSIGPGVLVSRRSLTSGEDPALFV